MDRREFCRTAIAAGVTGSMPLISACERAARDGARTAKSVAAASLDGAEIELEAAAIRELGESLSGSLLLSDHPEYDSVRKIWNGMHDRRPALIARCEDARDVSQAVTFARERELLVAVRGGGHSWPGKSVCDGGLMIDLSPMHRVTVDPEPGRAHTQGGGGNFGIVTEFEYQLHPFPRDVLSGNIVWPMEQARDVLEFYGEWHAGLSDDLYVAPAMMTTPEGQGVVVMEVVYAGDPSAGERELAPLLRVGSPIQNGVTFQDYMVMQTQEDALAHHGIRSYAKSGMAREITPDFVDAMIEACRPDPRVGLFSHTLGGAVGRVDELATAFPHRQAEIMLVFVSMWDDPADDEVAIETTRGWYGDLEPFTGGYYQNIEFEIDASAPGNYGPAYRRLREVKARHDPMNLFRMNSNVRPAT